MIKMSEEYLESVASRMVHLFISRSIEDTSNDPPTKEEREFFALEFKRRKEIQKEMLGFLFEHKNAKLTDEFIHNLHRILKKDEIGQEIGHYKTTQNFIIGVSGIVDDQKATPEETSKLMSEWIEKQLIFLNEENLTEEQVAQKIAKSHIDFESIHPYQDGNGNIGRILMAYLSLKRSLPPVIIPLSIHYKYNDWVTDKNYEELGRFILESFSKEEEIYKQMNQK